MTLCTFALFATKSFQIRPNIDRTCRNLKGDVCDLVLLPMEKRLQQLYGKHQINKKGYNNYMVSIKSTMKASMSHIIERHNHFKYPLSGIRVTHISETYMMEVHSKD